MRHTARHAASAATSTCRRRMARPALCVHREVWGALACAGVVSWILTHYSLRHARREEACWDRGSPPARHTDAGGGAADGDSDATAGTASPAGGHPVAADLALPQYDTESVLQAVLPWDNADYSNQGIPSASRVDADGDVADASLVMEDSSAERPSRTPPPRNIIITLPTTPSRTIVLYIDASTTMQRILDYAAAAIGTQVRRVLAAHAWPW